MEVGLNGDFGVTRRGFLRAAGAAWVVGVAGCEPFTGEDRAATPLISSRASARGLSLPVSGPVRTFRSRPDLAPPAVTVSRPAAGVAPGYVFVAVKKGPGQDGPMILDNDGEMVWFRPQGREELDAMDCKVQTYKGEPVLTWWTGVHGAWGQGEYIILDGRYREVARVGAGNGLHADLHEMIITEDDTALITIYHEVPYDLTPFGGRGDGKVAEGIVQELNVETGEVLFEWRSLDHVAVEETHGDLPEDPENAYDYFHINSIDVDADGDLLVSARKTFAVYKIDRGSGEVIWRLGGKRSDFEMGEGTKTLYQHDARRQPDGTISIFDNGGENFSEESRIIHVDADEETMRATLVREQTHPDGVFALTQGNGQKLPNGNLFVGWGSEPVFSEFSEDGVLLFSADFPPDVESYRAFRHPWTGRPETGPSLTAAPSPDEGVVLFASWNGSTDVENWQVLAGASMDDLRPAASVPRTGFETAIAVRTEEPLLAVRALDGSGRALGTSPAVNIREQGS